MHPEYQFWLQWSVSVLAAIGTVTAVVVALFGERIRHRLFKPDLSLGLLNPEGEATTVSIESPNGEARREHARYYHVALTNKSRWPKATQVQVHLIRIEDYDASGEPRIVWDGDVPVLWQFQEIHPLAREVGKSAICDLCSVVKGKWVQLHPVIVPHSLNSWVVRRDSCKMIVTLQAKSSEADSKLARFEISWNGKWDQDAKEMSRHLVVKQIQ